jgi:glycosyltransferase involved in cell wall biosynthesis
MKVLFITQYDERGASSRCRVYQYLPPLAARGIAGEVLPRFPAAGELWRRANAADAVVLQKRVPSLTRLLLLRRRAPRLLFDFDDAIWLRGASAGKVRPAPLRKRLRLAATLRLADRVIAGNEYLAAYARRWTPRVTVLPTPVDMEYYGGGQWVVGSEVNDSLESVASPLTSLPTAIRLGWVGHPSTMGYLRRLEPALAGLARQHPELRLRVVCSEPYHSEGMAVENVPWSLAAEVANLRRLDIGLMPLDDDSWARGKCGYKALQYMAVGIPVVCSPVGMNTKIVTEGETGLVAGEMAAWERQLSRLIESPLLRQRLGAAGQCAALQQYGLARMAPRLADLLARACTESRHRRRMNGREAASTASHGPSREAEPPAHRSTGS